MNSNQKKSDSEEIVITNDEFYKRLDHILKKIASLLLSNNKGVKGFFKEIIFSHDLRNTSLNQVYEAIPIKLLMKELENYKIDFDDKDLFCLYTKMKYHDEFDSIDLTKLAGEMTKYGVYDMDLNTDQVVFENLIKFLNDNKLKLKDIFDGKN